MTTKLRYPQIITVAKSGNPYCLEYQAWEGDIDGATDSTQNIHIGENKELVCTDMLYDLIDVYDASILIDLLNAGIKVFDTIYSESTGGV